MGCARKCFVAKQELSKTTSSNSIDSFELLSSVVARGDSLRKLSDHVIGSNSSLSRSVGSYEDGIETRNFTKSRNFLLASRMTCIRKLFVAVVVVCCPSSIACTLASFLPQALKSYLPA